MSAREKSIGFWDGDESKVVGLTCTLVIHYPFVLDKKLSRENAHRGSLQVLRDTLGPWTRFCETSASIATVLHMLADRKAMTRKFRLRDDEVPELLLIFIMTHGNRDGSLSTDHGESFNLRKVYCELDKNPLLSNALKLIFVSACRGTVKDEFVQLQTDVPPTKDKRVTPSTKITKKGRENVNAVRVTVEKPRANFITTFDSVESSAAYCDKTNGGHWLPMSVCSVFTRVDEDVGLDEFLTRCMCVQSYHSHRYNRRFISTPEMIVYKHRQLTITKKHFLRVINRDLLWLKAVKDYQGPIRFDYDWQSDRKKPLLVGKAHFYVTPQRRDSDEVRSLQASLRDVFGFEIESHENLKQLESGVSGGCGGEEMDGCVLVCIVAPLSKSWFKNELRVTVDGSKCLTKDVVYTAIGPSTARWIGKPKIFLFLHSPLEKSDRKTQATHQDYSPTDYSRANTIHAGLLAVYLPQNDALEYLIKSLEEFTRPGTLSNSTFQQFFLALVRNAEAENGIQPLVSSTLEKRLSMDFPVTFFPREFSLAKSKISLGELEKKVLEAREHAVLAVSGDAGAGKSALAAHLAGRARRQRKRVALVDLRRAQDASNLEDSELVLLDGFDASEASHREVLSDLAKTQVVVFTRPGGEPGLQSVSIDRLSAESKAVFLQKHLPGSRRTQVARILAQVGDLSDRVGTLRLVARFLRSTNDSLNLFLLVESVVKASFAAALAKQGFQPQGHAVCRQQLRRQEALHAACARHHFLRQRQPLEPNLGGIADFGVFRVQDSRLLVISETMAAYFFVTQEESFDSVDQSNDLLFTLWHHRELSLKANNGVVDKASGPGWLEKLSRFFNPRGK